jgi:hypothetical protein
MVRLSDSIELGKMHKDFEEISDGAGEPRFALGQSLYMRRKPYNLVSINC